MVSSNTLPVRVKRYKRGESVRTVFSLCSAGANVATMMATTSEEQSNRVEERTTVNTDERQYQQLVQRILQHGSERDDRTGTGTIATFGEMLSFDLSNNTLPLLTIKRINYRSVVGELLWFLRGETSSLSLEREGIRIWTGNGSRAALDRSGLSHYETGELGPVYGFQWRHAGLEYRGCHEDYFEEARRLADRRPGYDQVRRCLDLIRENPHSRRILMSAWNVLDIDKMALPPCHVLLQFFPDNNATLSGMVYMRSSDVGLGLPFNIASYATLLHLTAKMTNRKAKTLKLVLGDAHIYKNHATVLGELCRRTPFAFPQLRIRDREEVKDMREFEIEDFIVTNYKHHRSVKLDISI